MKCNYHTHTYRCQHAVGKDEDYVRAALDAGRVKRLNVEGVDVKLYRQLIYSKGKWITPAMQAMIALICGGAATMGDGRE